ncbi:MAG: PDZ domain-containing protein [Bryobacteraceae bacterium]|jgi:PDZ domain-containing protein
MKVILLLLFATLLGAAGESGTVGLNALRIYSDDSQDKQGPAVVIDVMENTPAAKAGIRNGDIIVGINGTDVDGKGATETLHANLAGPPGGSVKLTLWRPSEGRQFEAELTRVPYPLRRNPAGDPFLFSSPANWRPEVDQFPLPWSPQLTYHGWEDLVFAPNFDDEASPNYHSYAFILWLEGRQEFSTERLQADLLTYFKGISEERGRTRKFTPDLNRVSMNWAADGQKAGMQSFHGHATFYNPAGQLFTVHGEASLQFCANADHTAGVFILSPREPAAPIWNDLRAIRESFRCDRP